MRYQGVIRFSVSLEPNLLEELDGRIIGEGYASRSELIRDMIRSKIVEDEWKDPNKINTAVLVVVYNHSYRDLNRKIIDIQHNSILEVLCTTHVHIDANNCLETIILRGKTKDIKSFGFGIAGLKGVKFSKLTYTSSFE